MKVTLTKQECIWLVALAEKARVEAETFLKETPGRFFELRRDNMADLQKKLNAAIQKQNEKEKGKLR